MTTDEHDFSVNWGTVGRKFGQMHDKVDLPKVEFPRADFQENIVTYFDENETPQQREKRERIEEDALADYFQYQREQERIHLQEMARVKSEQEQVQISNRSVAQSQSGNWYDGLVTLLMLAAVIAAMLLVGTILSSIGLGGNGHGARWNP